MATLVSTLVTQLTQRVGENETFWTEQEKVDAVNEALMVWQLMTGDTVTSFDVSFPATSTTSSGIADVPTQMDSVLEAAIGNDQLTLISMEELDEGLPGWQDPTNAGTPIYWAPMGLTQIALNPPPSTPTIVSLLGYQEMQRLLYTDYIPIEDEEVDPILDYAHHYLTVKEGSLELQNTIPALARFAEAAGLRNGRFKQSAPYRYFMGLDRDEDERPAAGSRSIGIRG